MHIKRQAGPGADDVNAAATVAGRLKVLGQWGHGGGPRLGLSILGTMNGFSLGRRPWAEAHDGVAGAQAILPKVKGVR